MSKKLLTDDDVSLVPIGIVILDANRRIGSHHSHYLSRGFAFTYLTWLDFTTSLLNGTGRCWKGSAQADS